jgi:hypothetical protein
MAELLLLNSFFHLKLLKFSSGCGWGSKICEKATFTGETWRRNLYCAV